MSHLPQNTTFYASQIYAPIQSNQIHGYLKAIHMPREVEQHLQIPHEIETVRTHSYPSIQRVEVRFLALRMVV